MGYPKPSLNGGWIDNNVSLIAMESTMNIIKVIKYNSILRR